MYFYRDGRNTGSSNINGIIAQRRGDLYKDVDENKSGAKMSTYSMTLEEFSEASGIHFLPLGGKQNDMYNAMPDGAKDRFKEADFKPGWVMVNTKDGSSTYYSSNSEKSVKFTKEEVAEYFGGPPPITADDINGTNVDGVSAEPATRANALSMSGMEEQDFTTWTSTLSPESRAAIYTGIVNNGGSFKRSELRNIFTSDDSYKRFIRLAESSKFLIEEDELGG